MLYRVELENFYCFRDPQVIDLRVRGGVPDMPERFAPIYPGSKHRAPVAVAIYGANASGKSTFLKALTFLRMFLTQSASVKGFALHPFNGAAMANRPIRLAFEIGTRLSIEEQTAPGAPAGAIRYEVEFTVGDGVITQIARESLGQRPDGAIRFKSVFNRIGPVVKGSPDFPVTGLKGIQRALPPDASTVAFLAALHLEHPHAKALAQAVQNLIWSNIALDAIDVNDDDLINHLANDKPLAHALARELSRLDIGINNLSFRLAKDGKNWLAQFQHYKLDRPLPWYLESRGTRSFIRLYPMIARVLATGGLAVIDELDHSIHPHILPEILGWFSDPERNPYGAQIFTTLHSPSVLNGLDKEQVLFTEKDSDGAATIYALADIKGVRRDEDFARKYLGGVYGAVPHLG